MNSEPRRLATPPPAVPEHVRFVYDRLHGAGHRVLLAGGCLRDHLLGREIHDFDLATKATPEEVDALFDKTVLVGAQFGVVRVITGEDEEVEVARFRADLEYEDGRHPVGVRFASEREDALRRDFTINGLFYDLETGEVVDHVDGLADLDAKVLRAIGDPRERFREDRLRMLRAIRFATVLDFPIDPATWDAVVAEANTIDAVSGERIRDELEKILVHERREQGYHLLTDCGLMAEILPEVAAGRGVEQPPEYHPEGDVHVHTGIVIGQLVEPSFPLVLGALLHDIGKPRTFTVTDRIRFNKHESVGGDMAEEICQRLRLSNKETEEVVFLVRRHMIFQALGEMRVATRKRLFQEPHFESLLALCFADCGGSHGDTTLCEAAREAYQAFLAEPPRVEALLRGRDLMALGIAPGPQMGRILRAVEDARLEGAFDDRDAALAWVTARLGADGDWEGSEGNGEGSGESDGC